MSISYNNFLQTSSKDYKNISAPSLSVKIRQEIGISALRKELPITHLSNNYNVSRKFIYQQQSKVLLGLDKEFSKLEPSDEKILFNIPVTKSWLQQVTLSLLFDCKSSYRGVMSFFLGILNSNTCLGTIHNIVGNTAKKAIILNGKEELSGIKVGSHDEMFHNGSPILTGIDLESTYCYLLEASEKRDAESWAIHLLDCVEKGFDPEYIVADFGSGLRAGQDIALPNIPCHGDVFHALQEGVKILNVLKNYAYRRIDDYDNLYKKMQKALKKQDGRKYGRKLAQARKKQEQAIHLYDSLDILMDWMRQDILALSSISTDDRQKLYEFFLESLQQITPPDHKHLNKLLTFFTNQQKELLMFSTHIDELSYKIAKQFNVPNYWVRQLIDLQCQTYNTDKYWQLYATLQHIFKQAYYKANDAVAGALKKVFRASSMVENLNGRLRKFCDLRQNLGKNFLPLMRFFFNHNIFQRSRVKGRKGKTPAQLLTGNQHGHWLELLGFNMFSKT